MHTLSSRVRQSLLLLSVVLVSGTVRGMTASLLPTFQTPYVTRAETTMLLLQTQIPRIPELKSNGEFSDVAKGAWYERYLVVAERLKILLPDPVTHRVRPDDPVTRGEFLAITARTFGVDTDLFAPSYLDVSGDSWFAGAAGMAQRFHLFPADPDQTQLHPEEYMIHSEMARAVELLQEAIRENPIVKAGPDSQNTAKQKQSVAILRLGTAGSSSSKPSLFSFGKTSTMTADPAKIAKMKQDVLALVNAARTAGGLPALKQNGMLEQSAQQYATDMATQNFFGHVSPKGQTLTDRMQQSGYYKPFTVASCMCAGTYMIGENLARGQKTAQEVVSDWLLSPSHREAIMTTDFADTGIGISAGVWVEHFGGKQK